MGIITTIIGYLVLASAAISFFKAIEQVVAKRPGASNYHLFLLLLCISFLEASLGLYLGNFTAAMPDALFITGFTVFVAAAYLSGPLAYLYYNSLIVPSVGNRFLHLAPAVFPTLAAAYYLILADISYIRALRENFILAGGGIAVNLLLACAVAYIIAYTSQILAIELSVRKSPSIMREVRTLIFITTGLLITPIILLVGLLTKNIAAAATGALLLIFNNTLFILAHVRYRDFFLTLGREMKQAMRRKKMLGGINIVLLKERLKDLMVVEKYYRNFDISMAATAKRLSITPHQLSWFLNKKLRIDFRNYINRLRVEEAKELLIEDQGGNILAIGFHVGFGSKTSFNVAFKEFTGKTPTEYREEARKLGIERLPAS